MDYTNRNTQSKQKHPFIAKLVKLKEKLLKDKPKTNDSDATSLGQIGEPYNVQGYSFEHTGVNQAIAQAKKFEQFKKDFQSTASPLMGNDFENEVAIGNPKDNPDLGSGKPLRIMHLHDDRSAAQKTKELLKRSGVPFERERRNSDDGYGQMPHVDLSDSQASILEQNEQSVELQRKQNARDGKVREQSDSKDLKQSKTTKL
jgi:hypothetical protein